jgi:uncharacterized membrane protein YcaP (DUF421 family)
MEFLPANWLKVFAPETPFWELVARGAVLYFGILILMRFMPRRTGGELATMDLIFVILIAEAAAHAMGDYTSLTDGILLIAILMAWNYLVNFLSYHIPLVEKLVSAPPLQVVKDGRLLRRNMRREFLTEEELMDHLRQEGIENLKDVKEAYIEGEGKITVISNTDGKH